MNILHHLARRLLPMMLACVATAWAQPREFCDKFPASQQPRLESRVAMAEYVGVLPPTAPEKYRSFRGLLIEENLVMELYPLLTFVFFDEGSAAAPERYHFFRDPSQTEGFSDTTLRGGTLEKYYEMPNIIGYRMRRHPETTIEIVGCNSQQPDVGETLEISKARGELLRNYLVTIWGIDPARITMLPPRNFPEARSNPKDPLGLVENRRAEIRSNHWEIVKPLVVRELRRYPQPETYGFAMSNGIPDQLVARREIVITRGGEPWQILSTIGITDTVVRDVSWGRNGDEADVPIDDAPYRARLVLYARDGSTCSSPEIEIPVLTVTPERKRLERLIDRTIDRYSLVLFTFDSPEAGPLNERIIKEYIVNSIRKGARITVTGYSGYEEEFYERVGRLAGERANTVRKIIVKYTKPGLIESIEAHRAGAYHLYNGDLPEGRFYNRTVQVIIETPT